MWRLNFRTLVAVIKGILRLAAVILFMNIIKETMLIWGNMLEKCWLQKKYHAKMKMLNYDKFMPVKRGHDKSRIVSSASNHCSSRSARRCIIDIILPEHQKSSSVETLARQRHFPKHIMMNHFSTLCVCILVENPSQSAFADPELRIQTFKPVYMQMCGSGMSALELAKQGFYFDNIGYVLCYWCHSQAHIGRVLNRQQPTHTPDCGLLLQPQPQNYRQLLCGTQQNRLD